MTTSRPSFILTLIGLLISAPAIHADNSGRGKGGEIEIESFSWGSIKNSNSGTPSDLNALSQKTKPLIKEKKPSYPAPAVETWQGKRFPPPAPAQPALKQK